MRGLVGAVLAVGLLMGCGGIEGEAELQAAHSEDSGSDVKAAGLCEDCHWIYVRCMSRATTPEAQMNCEYGRMDCEATWCVIQSETGSSEAQ